ncbi:MAG: haloacid dehalogenase-like hydrolase [Bacilli bacterium]|nr:haloacid dehalogenase-like hydrolase [Bacilli bacterium]
MSKKPVVAIMYDFDKTLCTSDMQDYGFIPAVNMTPSEFWGKTGEFGDKYQVEKILAYMYVMVKAAKDNNLKLTKANFKKMGENIVYYPGVLDWFSRINKYGDELGIKVEHYVISSGTKEIIEGSKIAKDFTQIYACEFYFDKDEDGDLVATWPKLTINYTQKTQFVFRISKGVKKITEDDKVNARMDGASRHVRYQNMIYVGDGITDIPCMQLVKDKGGISIAVYNNRKNINAKQLFKDDRVNFICEADYSDGSEIDSIIKEQIHKVAINEKLIEHKNKQVKKYGKPDVKGVKQNV